MQLWRPFWDGRLATLDSSITVLAGRTIEEIFEADGEGVFREWERQALRAVRPQTVCAVGGGALVQQDNMNWALEQGLVIFLQVHPGILARRLELDAQRRPLLENEKGQRLSGAALLERVTALLEHRNPSYERAHITIPAANYPPGEIGKRVVEAYRSRKDWR